ncbi:hypothetical protein B0H67DRAFT_563822 [Lasiosphaeris hirsuta]|uniref:Uncharacterized protein n=1 Tax=Lasiosphaeris hirsuta TaxID=260670 RepID=A0AA40BBM3_9PEZI|nr:hypothetical protein B0H67DRAFT_563822 [Lasiosphaeris hirsuta]
MRIHHIERESPRWSSVETKTDETNAKLETGRTAPPGWLAEASSWLLPGASSSISSAPFG